MANSTASESQLEAKAKATAPARERLLAACRSTKKARTEKYYPEPIILPEIIFKILLLFPASVLVEIMRFVCKEWNAIITDPFFARAHLHSFLSPGLSGFLVQDDEWRDARLKQAFFLYPTEAPQYSCTKLELPFRAIILGSCNGLVLLQNSAIRRELFVVNLVTKANISLPPLNLAGVRVLRKPSTALVFAPSSGQYKVVYVSFISKNKRAPYVKPGKESYYCARFEIKVMVHTIAVDQTWRAIDCKGITMSNDAKETLMSQPLSSAGGYVYWFHHRHNYGFALDVDAETMYQFAGPKDYVMDSNVTHSIKMDTGGVGMVHLQSRRKCWKVWEMIDPKTSIWGRAMDLHVARMFSKVLGYFPLCVVVDHTPLLISLKNGDLWFYCQVFLQFRLVMYNWKTRNMEIPQIKWPWRLALPHLHVNSLLSPKKL